MIGDAPSLGPSASTYSEKDIIELAKADNINMNFYPIVLNPSNEVTFSINKMQNLTFIESVYPNPTNGPFSLIINQHGAFNLEVFDQNGAIVKSEIINTDSYNSDLYDYPNGLYIIRVSDENKNYDTRKIILNK